MSHKSHLDLSIKIQLKEKIQNKKRKISNKAIKSYSRIIQWLILKEEESIKAMFAIIWKMDRVSFNLMTEVIMLDHGKIIKCMATESYTTKMAKLHTKAIGKMISFVDLAEFSMIDLINWLILLIIKTSLIWDKNGYITRAILRMTQSMEKVSSDSQMVKYFKGILFLTPFKEKEHFIRTREKQLQVFGKTTCLFKTDFFIMIINLSL